MYAEVVLAKTSSFSDKVYHYSIPPNLVDKILVGAQVLIPFGPRSTVGYVIGLVGKADVEKVKDILEATSDHPLFTEKQVELAKWIADYYCSFFSSALKLVMGSGGKEQRAKIEDQNKSQGAKIKDPKIKLTDEQEAAFKAIKAAVEAKQTKTFLLHGITGSGKTEVYMRATAAVLEQGESAIILVPEIGLTPQIVERFRDRFGDQIAVLHSALTLKQRQIEWQRIKNKEAQIILGARSAIFAPVEKLGLVVIDEEYETTYKSDKSPRYHAREVSDFLAKQHKAVLVLGSATPSLETYYQTEQGKITKLVLSKRIDDRALPEVKIIDMREDRGFILSEQLRLELKTTIENKQQAILFINRRGYFTFIMCQKCGFTVECPQCAISLTYHTKEQKLRCHRCDYSTTPPRVCPQCNASAITYFGTGTQRIENEVATLIPGVRILRYDRDAVSKRGSHEVIFRTFAEGAADILIGTQMVTKGLDVANVTLVGVVSADTNLRLPDFRAAEHTFQLLTQVAGRAGRHHLPGKVIIQSYSPEHYAIQAAAKQDYELFYNQEIKHRQELGYPPFSKIISLTISGKEEAKVAQVAEELGELLKAELKQGVLGPASAPVPRVRGQWRYGMLVKTGELKVASSIVAQAINKLKSPKDVRVTIDVEPMGLV
ncbi:primosomal protein N' [candidate division WOR-1 bacterium RIFOXYB2_FULL_42_35]|uniref:Replication restart protein PriA n=1 Tax=candidate division WOR-1 bacterium RIFOXYC2_FULL_41_25 TaxID=1802586 RepID=A0A1F4TJV2_UNCSA|nr:MAG: primosomal protein N' [candidate division WOR-1 bacterium RIFOXYA2_FULL_41_14]OGC23488.1 MAG: primosomal protein N' [candidate division WOR-1 bacterium RIFOXYB2_FULL_42_35]OGC33011.1 MAG: primosomal protein N' [candidate division WOR-1 bacterium RIFOXYC2_FULL_41_25]